jgi:hypothetical protein
MWNHALSVERERNGERKTEREKWIAVVGSGSGVEW